MLGTSLPAWADFADFPSLMVQRKQITATTDREHDVVLQKPYLAWIAGSAREGEGELWLYNEQTGARTNFGYSMGSLSGSGGKLVYLDKNSQVAVYDIASDKYQALTTGSVTHFNPQVSNRLVIWGDQIVAGPPSQNSLQVYDLKSGTRTTITSGNAAEEWAVGGAKVVFRVPTATSGISDLRVYDADARTTTTIRSGGFDHLAFDGTHILIRDINTGITVTDLSGNPLGNVANLNAVVTERLSGDWVVWSDGDDFHPGHMFLWRWTTGEAFLTSPDGGLAGDLAIDGTQIAFIPIPDSSRQTPTLDDVYTVDFTPPALPQSNFTDSFDGCISSAGLGSNWAVTGTWYCSAARARGEGTNGVALAQTDELGDMRVTGLVQLNGSSASGIVVRAHGSSFYLARIIPQNSSGDGGRLEIVRKDGSTETILAVSTPDLPAIVDSVSYTLALSATGTNPVQLVATVNGPENTVRVTDASGVATGRGGFFHGTGFRTQFDNFAVRGTTATVTPPPPSSFNIADSFDACTSTNSLGSNWDISGTWYCKAGQARGESASGVALAKGTTGADMNVSARVQLTAGATSSGVVARASGTTWYAARILITGRLQIVRVNNGSATILADVPATIQAEPSSYRVTLKVTGSSSVGLTASLNGTPVASATDTSGNRIAQGRAGMVSGTTKRTQYDSFTAQSD